MIYVMVLIVHKRRSGARDHVTTPCLAGEATSLTCGMNFPVLMIM